MSSSVAARVATRRASTALSIRPRPTAPAKRPTVRSQPARSGRSATISRAPVVGAGPPVGVEAAGPCSPAVASRARASHQPSTSAGSTSLAGSGAMATVRLVVPPLLATPNVGRTSDAAPNGAQGSSGRRCPAAEAETAEERRTGLAVIGRAAGHDGVREDGPPGVGRDREPVGPLGFDGPCPPDPDDRPVASRLEPERGLQALGPGGGEQLDRIERVDRERGREQRSRSVASVGRREKRPDLPGDGRGRSGRRRRSGPRRSIGDGHAPSSGGAAIRASSTPTLRRSRARRVG